MVEMISIKQACNLVKIDEKDLEDLARHGLVPCTKIGQQYLFTKQSLLHWKRDYYDDILKAEKEDTNCVRKKTC